MFWIPRLVLLGLASCSTTALEDDAIVHAVRDWYLAKGGPHRILLVRQHEVEPKHRARILAAGLALKPIETMPILERRRLGLPFLRAGIQECRANNETIAHWEGWWLRVYLPAERSSARAIECVVELGYNEFEANLEPWEEVEVECFGTILVRGGHDALGRPPARPKGGLLLFQFTPCPQEWRIEFLRKL